jgi:large subunit ribosomal protein L1
VVDPDDIAKAIEDSRQGRVEFRLDRTALIHVPIGKVSFEEDKLLENMATIVDAIVKAKPAGTKGQYIRAASLATTMGPGIRLELAPTLAMTSS